MQRYGSKVGNNDSKVTPRACSLFCGSKCGSGCGDACRDACSVGCAFGYKGNVTAVSENK